MFGLVEEIRQTVTDLPSYGYRRVWGMLRRESEGRDITPVNAKRVYRVMRVHGLLPHLDVDPNGFAGKEQVADSGTRRRCCKQRRRQ